MSSGASTTPARVRALLALYREAHYDVVLPRGEIATLKVGAAAPSPLLRWIGRARVAVYLTACNPRSEPLPAAENASRLDRLKRTLEKRAASYLEGIGHVPGERWREPSLFVRGLDLADIDALMAEYDQNAVVVARPGAASTLRLYREEWRAFGAAGRDLEWADGPEA